MSPLVVLVGLGAGAGAVLLLSALPWFARRSLRDRLAGHQPGGPPPRAGVLSVASFRDVLAPAFHRLGDSLARLLGVEEDLSRRLRRIHSDEDVTAFRLRQAARGCLGLVTGLALGLVVGAAAPLALLLALGGGLLALLLVEQQVAAASDRWRRTVRRELPVVAEQLGMLIGAGWSTTAAMARTASRGHGAVARDLARVTARIEQGADEADALREWAALADVDAVDRLVGVLVLQGHGGDLGRLVSAEARAGRAEVHRELLASIERRGQQVWVPVTVATLVPGMVFIAVPFHAALTAFLG